MKNIFVIESLDKNVQWKNFFVNLKKFPNFIDDDCYDICYDPFKIKPRNFRGGSYETIRDNPLTFNMIEKMHNVDVAIHPAYKLAGKIYGYGQYDYDNNAGYILRSCNLISVCYDPYMHIEDDPNIKSFELSCRDIQILGDLCDIQDNIKDSCIDESPDVNLLI